jgi:putative ABC transport system ATP-binding protein
VFIEGPSGSGKSTLLNLLTGLVTPDTGEIAILGTNIGALSGPRRDAFRSAHIGLVFQMFNLIPYLSAMENVLLPCRFSAARGRAMAEAGTTAEAEARRLLSHLQLDPEQLEAGSVTRLSAGQQQRVAVARALIGKPELMICDEPTSALDGDAARAFLALIFAEAAASGATLIFVSHDKALAELFDRTIVLPEINEAAGAPVP